MARKRLRNRKGQYVKGHSALVNRRRKTARVVSAKGRRTRRVRVVKHPVLVNPRRHTRRRVASNPRRRTYRRNPASFASIFSKPTLKNVGFAVVGLAGTPMLTGFIQRYLPSALIGNKWAGYALKGASAWGLSMVADKVAGKEAGRAVLIGGLAYTALGIVTDFFPTLLSIGGSTGTARYLQRQPLLAGAGEYASMRGPITSGARKSVV